MKIAINNFDGKGVVDYAGALDAVRALTIVRKLNEPSVCELWLSLPSNGALAEPVRNAALTVTGDDGTAYFTGYIAVAPLPEFAGVALEGPRYRIALQAVSDEILLDMAGMVPSATVAGLNAGDVLASLVTRTGYESLSVQGLIGLSLPMSAYTPELGASWSKAAGQVAAQTRASYRALNGVLSASRVGNTVHALSETDGSLELANLAMTASVKRALANDVTVCGAEEPAAYVTEFFVGDGATVKFALTAVPYFLPTTRATLIDELFNEAKLDTRYWFPTSASYFSLSGGGLSLNGGAGVDGQTVISWNNPVEMGGTLLLESIGVELALGSSGILSAFYSGTTVASNCLAGFQVTSAAGTGVMSLQPVIDGVAAGQVYPLNAANQYALRVRVHCPEVQRVLPVYSIAGDDGIEDFGGGGVIATGRAQLEIQEFVNGVGGTPVVLFDGAIGAIPATATVVAASSLNLIGSVRGVSLTSLGSGWVVSTPPGATAYSRRMGTTEEAAECKLIRVGTASESWLGTGYLEFYSGYAPVAGEVVAVSYRAEGRAVGRAVNADSQAMLAANGMPPSAVWIGTVTNPEARSSVDCRNAAAALVAAASSVSAAWAGTYKGWRGSFQTDVWPGDALALSAPSTNLNAQVVVRQVTVSYAASSPDFVQYSISFANDWANDLAIKTSESVPATVALPAPVAPTYLANLNALTAVADGSVVTVNANVTPPAGGGFEVRTRDLAFMPGTDTTLVLRSPVASFTIPRQRQQDTFFIRMYDACTPPNYSEMSAAVFVNMALAAS